MEPNVPAPAPVVPEPTAPVVAPVVPEPTAPVQTPEQQADANEWDAAEKDVFPGLKPVKEDKKDEPTDTTTTTTEAPSTTETTTQTTTVAPDPNETPEQKTAREAQEAADAAAATSPTFNQAAHDARVNSRAYAEQVQATAADVKSKMFANLPQQLQDGDGDPIRGVEDVMQLINPVTQEAFTREEAGVWLVSAQQKFNQNLAATEKKIEAIAQVNVDLKDQADFINHKYGAMLKADTKLRDELWLDFEKTLVKDPESGVITGMPMSLERFYEIACEPRAAAATAPTTTPETTVATTQTPEQKAEADRAAEAAKQAERADRSDIFGGANPDANVDEDTKEWQAAEAAVFPGLKRTK